MVYVRKVLFGSDITSEIGRASLRELGTRSPWWKRVEKFALLTLQDEVFYLIASKEMTEEGIQWAGLSQEERKNLEKEGMEKKIEAHGRDEWRNMLQGTERTRRYAEWKGRVKLERYADGSTGARVRMMVRGDSLLVRSNPNVAWKYGEDGEEKRCSCGAAETERHVLLECSLYEQWRVEWERVWRIERGDEDMMEGVLGFESLPKDLDKLILSSVGKIWNAREKRERERESS